MKKIFKLVFLLMILFVNPVWAQNAENVILTSQDFGIQVTFPGKGWRPDVYSNPKYLGVFSDHETAKAQIRVEQYFTPSGLTAKMMHDEELAYQKKNNPTSLVVEQDRAMVLSGGVNAVSLTLKNATTQMITRYVFFQHAEKGYFVKFDIAEADFPAVKEDLSTILNGMTFLTPAASEPNTIAYSAMKVSLRAPENPDWYLRKWSDYIYILHSTPDKKSNNASVVLEIVPNMNFNSVDEAYASYSAYMKKKYPAYSYLSENQMVTMNSGAVQLRGLFYKDDKGSLHRDLVTIIGGQVYQFSFVADSETVWNSVKNDFVEILNSRLMIH